ncbi:hypothetical protein IAQ61_003623 [Plenodomus lingam]|uniref:uncharacterized protein n=1 Tax=Leptosphaeria maculans TaxID=5022 RepID=UPI003320817F|nr:hypothetical protein IAQ61_003623 [Plenodomus lingam]
MRTNSLLAVLALAIIKDVAAFPSKQSSGNDEGSKKSHNNNDKPTKSSSHKGAPSPKPRPQPQGGHSNSSSSNCHVTTYDAIPAAVSGCTDITLDGITVPGKSTIDLSSLKQGSKVTFAGRTFWEHGDANYPLVKISGVDVEITGAEGAVLDGNGACWWDGLGSNGGVAKPNHFFQVRGVSGKSCIHDLYIENYPVHGIMVSGSSGLDIHHVTLNNTAGEAPNSRSNGKPASHNSDGFGMSSTTDSTIHDCTVINQDDCVAVTSGNNILIENMECLGSPHGLSIGSVGGKSNNTVTNVTFKNSNVRNSENGIRIKSNENTTGLVQNILFENIHVENIFKYGIVLQQDYLNGGPTGKPTNGVKFKDITIRNIKGTATKDAKNYYILCGKGSCENITIDNVDITGGGEKSTCNFKTSGSFDCDGGFQ